MQDWFKMSNTVVALVYLLILGGLYFGFYYLNHITPAPKGMEDLKADCDGCQFSDCGNHPSHNYPKEMLKHD